MGVGEVGRGELKSAVVAEGGAETLAEAEREIRRD